MNTQQSAAIALASTISLGALVIALLAAGFGAMFGGCEVRHLSEKHACRDGSIEKCLAVAKIYDGQRDDLMTDVLNYGDTMRTYYGRACELGSPEGCYRHAANTYVANDAPGWAKEEIREFTLGCDAKIPEACAGLGDIYAGGVGVPRDDARALALYVPSCAAKVADACLTLGYIRSQGRGGLPRDDAAALQYFQQACDAGHSTACFEARWYTDNHQFHWEWQEKQDHPFGR